LKWLKKAGLSQPTASTYVRIAEGWDQITSAGAGANSLREAIRLLEGQKQDATGSSSNVLRIEIAEPAEPKQLGFTPKFTSDESQEADLPRHVVSAEDASEQRQFDNKVAEQCEGLADFVRTPFSADEHFEMAQELSRMHATLSKYQLRIEKRYGNGNDSRATVFYAKMAAESVEELMHHMRGEFVADVGEEEDLENPYPERTRSLYHK
jgi:hypothetical protein